jgi:hypothetical protein
MDAGCISLGPRFRRRAVFLRAVAACAAAALAATAPALTLDVPRLPAPAFADREASADAAIPASAAGNLRRFRLELSFDATPSNNVQAAFGRDAAPHDGALAAEETAFVVGWDGGEWFLRPAGLKERFAHAPSDGPAPRRRTLHAAIRVDAAGVPASVAFGDDAGAFAFEGLPASPPPPWLSPGEWDLLRVTVRGAAAAEEDVLVRFLPDGAVILLR